MKKLLLSFSAVLAASSLMAQQYDMEAILETPTEGSSVVGTASTTLSYGIKNNGPAVVDAGDTIWLSYTVGQDLYDLDGAINSASGVILPADFPVGFTLTSAMIGATVQIDLSGITTNTMVCALIIGTNAAIATPTDPRDADNANNLGCFTATPAPAALKEEAIVASVYPNPASDVLNFKSSDEIATVTILTMDGKVMAKGTTNSISISELSVGTYVYIATTVTGKTAIGNFAKN